MAGKPAVLSVRIVTDAKSAQKDMDKTGQSLDNLGKDARNASKEVGAINERFGETASRSSQVAGGFGDLGGALSQMNGPLGAVGTGMETLAPSIMGLTGAADLLEVVTGKLSLANIKNTASMVGQKAATIATSAATKAMTAGQWLLNAALSANPIGIVVIAVIALIAIFVLAYTKIGWFRDLVQSAFKTIQSAISTAFNWVKSNWPLMLAILTGPIGLAVLAISRNWDTIKGGATGAVKWVSDKFDGLIGFFTKMPGRIASAASGMWNGILDAFKYAMNTIISGWNRIEFKIPGFKLGPVGYNGFTLGVPDIDLIGGAGLVAMQPGQTGFTLMASGGNVIPFDRAPTIRARSVSVTPSIHIEFNGLVTDPDAAAQEILRLLKGRGVRIGTAA